MRCPSCGQEVPDEPFCELCGKPLGADHARVTAPPDSASPPVSPPRQGMGWASLCMALYLAIADGAVESVWRQVPARWWIAGGAGIYLALCLTAWRLMPKLWDRSSWGLRSTVSGIVLLGAMAASLMLPHAFMGMTLLTAPMSAVLAVMSALGIAGATVLLMRSPSPLAARAIGALLGAYGIVAFALAAKSGTSYPALFHGSSFWSHAPSWLQGAVVGNLYVVPAALVVGLTGRFSKPAAPGSQGFSFAMASLGMCVVVALVGLRAQGDMSSDGVRTAETFGVAGAEAAPASAEATPIDADDYQQMSKAFDRLNAAADVLNGKMDHSLFEIDALAAKLGSDPAVILQFVRDEIRYEPYVGALRGALGTLVSRAGNSLDRSLLLAALLQKAGLSVQISNGTLGDADARALVLRVFEPAKPVPSALPDLTALGPELGDALGADQQQMQRHVAEERAAATAGRDRLNAYVDNEAQFLTGLMTKAGVDATVLTRSERLAAEAKDHYWVRYQDASGKWLDLDSAFADAKPGQGHAESIRSFSPDAVPEELYHHLRIALMLRATADPDSGSSTDQVLLDRELRIPDLQGKAVTLASAPVPRIDPLKPGVTLAEVVDSAKVYQTALLVGDEETSGKGFDLQGRVGGVATPESVDVEQAGGVGGANGGLWGAIGGTTGGGANDSSSKNAGGSIVGEWVVYTMTSPEVAGGAARVRTYRRDIIAPVTVTSWSADSPDKPRTAPTHLALADLRRRLMWSENLLPVAGAPRRDYAAYMQLQALAASRPVFDAFNKVRHGLPIDRTTLTAPPQAMAATVWLAAIAMRGSEGHDGASAARLRSYFDEPGLIAYQRSIGGPSGQLSRKEGFDIVSYSPRLTVSPNAGAVDAAAVQVRRGVLATRLEAELSAHALGSDHAVESVANTTNVFSAAQRRGIPISVLQPGAAGTRKLAALAISDLVKAELAEDLGAGQTVIIPSQPVTTSAQSQIGWWRWRADSGELTGVMPGERGQAMTEKAIIDKLEALNAELCFLEGSKTWKEKGADEGMGKTFQCIAGMVAEPGMTAMGLQEYSGTAFSITMDVVFTLIEHDPDP